MRFSLENAKFLHSPYFIGLAKPVLDEESYNAMSLSFPPSALMSHWDVGYHKYVLSERTHTEKFPAYIQKYPLWTALQQFFKRQEFPY